MRLLLIIIRDLYEQISQDKLNNIKDDIMGAAAENVRTREEKTERKIKFFLSLF